MRGVAAESVEEQLQMAVLFMCVRHRKWLGIYVNSESVRGFFPAQTVGITCTICDAGALLFCCSCYASNPAAAPLLFCVWWALHSLIHSSH